MKALGMNEGDIGLLGRVTYSAIDAKLKAEVYSDESLRDDPKELELNLLVAKHQTLINTIANMIAENNERLTRQLLTLKLISLEDLERISKLRPVELDVLT